jgi:Tol biopolymer transport system component
MRGTRAIPGLGAVTWLLLLVAPSAEAVYPGANGQLSYEIVGFVPGPEWSPDGSKKAHREGYASGPVVKTNADGNGRTVVYDLAAHGYSGIRGLSWSADGAELVLAPYSGTGNSDLVVVSADGSQERSLTNTPTVSEAFPEWSPDGSKIAFARESQIATISPDGTELALLPTHRALPGLPTNPRSPIRSLPAGRRTRTSAGTRSRS